jgi:hypothetical protein
MSEKERKEEEGGAGREYDEAWLFRTLTRTTTIQAHHIILRHTSPYRSVLVSGNQDGRRDVLARVELVI